MPSIDAGRTLGEPPLPEPSPTPEPGEGAGAEAAPGADRPARIGARLRRWWLRATDPLTTQTPRGAGGQPRGPNGRWNRFWWVFGSVWLVYLISPLVTVFRTPHTTVTRALVSLIICGFGAAYMWLNFTNPYRLVPWRVATAVTLLIAAIGTTAALGPPWGALFVYACICCASGIPGRWALGALATGLVCEVATLYGVHDSAGDIGGLLLPSAMAAGTVLVSRRMVVLIVELRMAREATQRLAASEERLRLARDLHDLLGHSLSLITLKSELAGRLVTADPAAAAREIADVEQVSRQALVDVREAVSGYRRPTLADEADSALKVLETAGIEVALAAEVTEYSGQLPQSGEAALAWALRESVTNVIRHGQARRCAIRLVMDDDADDGTVSLVVENDVRRGGVSPEPSPYGNGLTGLAERLTLEGGQLTARPTSHGFRVTASIPVRASHQRQPRDRSAFDSGALIRVWRT